MSKLTIAKGNMYTGWVTHTWGCINGCEHQCKYCYVRKFYELKDYPEIKKPFPDLGEGNEIFICHTSDFFADKVKSEWILEILNYCKQFPNGYIFQTKNVKRMYQYQEELPIKVKLGTTIETNRQQFVDKLSKAPSIKERIEYFRKLNSVKFITIEPILDFDLYELLDLLEYAKPDFINLGADSKWHNLEEPTSDKTKKLIDGIKNIGIELNCKYNLGRLLNA